MFANDAGMISVATQHNAKTTLAPEAGASPSIAD